jgi:dTDP-4-dehydrorhamnose reductase
VKILVTGRNGQLGFELERVLARLGQVVAVGHDECDLADEEAIRQLVRGEAPDLVVNAAAYTAVDAAEQDRAAAFSVNARAPQVLAQECAARGALLVHFSTDYVFSGEKQGSYLESDPTGPLNVYGESKLEGERLVAAANPRHVILRTSWVVGAHGKNFAKTILRLAAERDSLSIVADQFGAPSPVPMLAHATAHLLERVGQGGREDAYGTYHLCGAGETNWCEYARFVVEEALRLGTQLKLRPEDIKPIPAASYPTPARRPANSRLDTSRFQATLGYELPHWRDAVRQVLVEIAGKGRHAAD